MKYLGTEKSFSSKSLVSMPFLVWGMVCLFYSNTFAQTPDNGQLQLVSGLVCPTVCPGEQLRVSVESITSDDKLAQSYGWKRAGCAVIDFSGGQLAFDFSSFDNSEDVDWLLVELNETSADYHLNLGLSSENHEGPILGRSSSPHVGSTGEDGSTSLIQGKYLLLYTQWGASAKTGQVSLSIGNGWESKCEACITKPYSITPNLVDKQATVFIPQSGTITDMTLQIFDMQGRVFKEYEGISPGSFDIDLSGFASGAGTILISQSENQEIEVVLQFIKS